MKQIADEEWKIRKMVYEDYDLSPDYEECESIDDIARGEGFYIDDDGHWIPLEEEDNLFW